MPNTKRCFCDDWEENIKKLNDPIALQSIRSGGKYQYDGKPWDGCPWCVSLLAESKEEWEKQNTGIKALVDFVRNQEDAPPEFNKVIDDNFWELLA